MTHTSPSNPHRREALRWGFGLTAGTVLAGCGNSDSATADTLPDPPMLQADKRQLSLELNAQYATQALDIAPSQEPAYPGAFKRVATTLRSFNGRYVAPTLVLSLGDTLRITLNNRLPPNVGGQSKVDYLNYQNSTNLHFHGLHVDPREFRPGVFGDYVVDIAEGGVQPGQSRQHEITIPQDHTSGINWYHPHLHGSSNVQVSSGMFGAILIRDPANRFMTTQDIRERVIHVHKVTLNAQGKTESFYDSVLSDYSGFLLNGAYQPTIVMRPGEVQNWHFINTGSFYPSNPLLDGHTMFIYARDGNVLDRRFQPINEATSTMFGNQQWPGNALFPGNRHSVVVKASATPGTYYLRSVHAPSSPGKDEIMARLIVEGAPMDTPLPDPANLPRYAEHLPISDEELAAHGGKQRNLVLAILPVGDPKLAAPIPPHEDWSIPLGDGADDMAGIVFASGDASPTAKLSPFQSSLTATQTVALNAVEEWTINSANEYPHPFHIHINDSCVVRVNGERVTPYWADTIPIPPKGSITFRMRFTDFHGKYVWHCHALDHEDLGMMQLVEVVA
ncbi:MAG: multicopper oxidase domain-containing protein [Pseudomonadota bacterium]